MNTGVGPSGMIDALVRQGILFLAAAIVRLLRGFAFFVIGTRCGQHFSKLVEKVPAVMGTGGRLRVILDTERWVLGVANSGDRLIVEISVSDFQFGRQGFLVDGKPMILRSDLNFFSTQIQDGLICAAMSELQLYGLGTTRQSQKLMTEANPEYGQLAQ